MRTPDDLVDIEQGPQVKKWTPPLIPTISMTQPTVRHFKVILLGNPRVGKSSISRRFTKGYFYESYEPSEMGKISVESVILRVNNTSYHVWDSHGHDPKYFKTDGIDPILYTGAHAVILVYDVCDEPSFHLVISWLCRVQKMSKQRALHRDMPIVAIVGNKIDLEIEGKREVPLESGQEFAIRHSLIFFEASAKTGENVQELFTTLAERSLNI